MILKKIVIAEDDDAIAHLVNMALGDAGFLCLRARDGEEAINLVRVHAPDLLVLDVMMPRASGHDVARKVKADAILSRTPILMLTALTTVDDKVEGFDAGADDYLVKPFDIRELSARVHALIRAARRERDRNPTSNLPGAGAMEDAISAALKDGRDDAVVHIEVSGFGAFAEKVAHTDTDDLIRALGQLVLECARARSAPFLGHLGGGDFVSVLPREDAVGLAGEVTRAFDGRRADLAGETGVDLSMKAAVAPLSGLSDDDEISVRLAAAIKAARKQEGSAYVVWSAELA